MPHNIDTSLLRAFVAAAETGGMTSAARLVNLTQAAVSQQVKRLEETFGRQLFERDRRGLRLTPSGERLLVRARRLLALNDEVWALMTAPDFTGEVRLGVLYTQIQTPRFRMTLAAPGADAMGRAGLDGDVQTFFWDRAGAVALFALMDTAIGAGQAAGTAALSRAVTGGNGSVLNFGSIGSQAQGLASQEMASRINRPAVVTRDQAMPMTVTVGQDLDFTDACKQAMRVDPMACPLL